jgi:hypothetical protein
VDRQISGHSRGKPTDHPECKIVLDAIFYDGPDVIRGSVAPGPPMRRISRQGFVGVAQKAQDRVNANPALEVTLWLFLLGVASIKVASMSSVT